MPRSTPPPDIEIRSLQTLAEYRECVRLQLETWNTPGECVPPAVLKVSQEIGGVAAGAFDPSGHMVGFVFGITGWRDGELCHWSDMLAVRPEFRDRGIGRRLKTFQRAWLLERRVPVMYWSYDPLVARNAHLNIEKLGARVMEYVPDMYGAGDASLLDGVIGTDRFVVQWRLDEERHDERGRHDARPGGGSSFPRDSAIVNPPHDRGAVRTLRRNHTGPATAVYIEIPPEIDALKVADVGAAAAWRAGTREAFHTYLGQGYTVTRFLRDETSDRCVYLLVPPTARESDAE
jgi:predicted GNAT superfamily acetyltransferase